MTDANDTSDATTSNAEDNPAEIIEYVAKPRKRSPLRRLGCLILLVIWLILMLLPLGFFVLAIQGDITILHGGDIPDRRAHPRFQVQLISEIDFRGLHFTRSTIHQVDETTLCLQTDVSYWLWQGEGEPATYCDCYERDITESVWQPVATNLVSCK